MQAKPIAAGPALALLLLLSPAAGQDTAAEWLAAGHAARADGKWLEALGAYEKAAALGADELDARLWEIRSWMELDRLNDALDAIDALAEGGREGPELDYLYGMAFARKAESYLAEGVTDSAIEMNFGDAVGLLQRATRAEPDRFADAFPHLATAAYFTQQNEIARKAAESAVERFPGDLGPRLLLGRVALSQFVAAQGKEGVSAEEADGHWKAARAAFQAGIEALGEPEGPADENTLAKFYVQLGYTYGWREEHAEDAAAAFGKAMAWDPTAVDYENVWNVVGLDRFYETAAAAAERFAARVGERDVRDATLLWFLGHAAFQKELWDEAEGAFQKSVERWPAYSDAWFYVGRARYAQGDFGGATDAFRRHWQASPEGLVATVAADAERVVPILEYLVGQSARAGQRLDAAFLSEVCAEAVQDDPRHWNNTGLFLRDEGERMLREDPDADVERRRELFERAFQAYSRALELSPDDPALLNDTALMLHYHLRRDLDQALAMYQSAVERAEEQLARPDLSEELRALYETARRDAQNNLELLESELEGEEVEADARARADAADGSAGTGH